MFAGNAKFDSLVEATVHVSVFGLVEGSQKLVVRSIVENQLPVLRAGEEEEKRREEERRGNKDTKQKKG